MLLTIYGKYCSPIKILLPLEIRLWWSIMILKLNVFFWTMDLIFIILVKSRDSSIHNSTNIFKVWCKQNLVPLNIACVPSLYQTSSSQYAHNVVLTSIRRRFNVMDVVWTSKRRAYIHTTVQIDDVDVIQSKANKRIIDGVIILQYRLFWSMDFHKSREKTRAMLSHFISGLSVLERCTMCVKGLT